MRRFLEQERVSPYSQGLAGKGDLKREIIDKGNAAARCGNAVGDSAQFKFGQIYKCALNFKAADWERYRGTKITMAINFEVTIHAGQGVHNGSRT